MLVLLGQLFLYIPFRTSQDEGLDHLHLKVKNISEFIGIEGLQVSRRLKEEKLNWQRH